MTCLTRTVRCVRGGHLCLSRERPRIDQARRIVFDVMRTHRVSLRTLAAVTGFSRGYVRGCLSGRFPLEVDIPGALFELTFDDRLRPILPEALGGSLQVARPTAPRWTGAGLLTEVMCDHVITRAELASAVGVSAQVVTHWRRGEYAIRPSAWKWLYEKTHDERLRVLAQTAEHESESVKGDDDGSAKRAEKFR